MTQRRGLVGCSAELASGQKTPWCGRSRLHKRYRVLFNPRDLKRSFVEHTATSELHLPRRTVGDQLPQVFLQVPHPLDPRMHDANLRLETIRVEQQAKAAGLFGD